MVSQACYSPSDGRRYGRPYPLYYPSTDRRFQLSSHDARAVSMTDHQLDSDSAPQRKRIAVAVRPTKTPPGPLFVPDPRSTRSGPVGLPGLHHESRSVFVLPAYEIAPANAKYPVGLSVAAAANARSGAAATPAKASHARTARTPAWSRASFCGYVGRCRHLLGSLSRCARDP